MISLPYCLSYYLYELATISIAMHQACSHQARADKVFTPDFPHFLYVHTGLPSVGIYFLSDLRSLDDASYEAP